LIVDAELETSRAPFYKVERVLRFEGCHSSVAVTRYDVSAIEKGYSHVLSVTGIADDL
jgi:hypothetical protein